MNQNYTFIVVQAYKSFIYFIYHNLWHTNTKRKEEKHVSQWMKCKRVQDPIWKEFKNVSAASTILYKHIGRGDLK